MRLLIIFILSVASSWIAWCLAVSAMGVEVARLMASMLFLLACTLLFSEIRRWAQRTERL